MRVRVIGSRLYLVSTCHEILPNMADRSAKPSQNSVPAPTILVAFYSFKKVLFFHCSLPHSFDSFQSEIYSLTWDGKCEKFSVLLQLFS